METVEVEDRQGFAVVRLNRPPMDAVNRVMMRELRACFESLSQDRSVGSVVLAAAGDRAFCAGIDIKDSPSREDGAGEGDLRAVLDPLWEWRQTRYPIRECLVPVIAAVEATAIGAGFGLIGVCDLVIAGEKATFGLTEINVGALGGASKALRLLGPSKARRCCSSASFSGGRALSPRRGRGGGGGRLSRISSHGIGDHLGHQEPDRPAPGEGIHPPHRG